MVRRYTTNANAHTFDQLRQICRILGFNCHTYDRRNREFHHLHIMRILECGNRTSFYQELINANKPTNVTCAEVNKKKQKHIFYIVEVKTRRRCRFFFSFLNFYIRWPFYFISLIINTGL